LGKYLAIGEINASYENALAFVRVSVDLVKNSQRQQDIQGAEMVMDQAEDGAEFQATVDEQAEFLRVRQLASVVNPYAASPTSSPAPLMLTSGSPGSPPPNTPSGEPYPAIMNYNYKP
jgi:hypothetical protein